jgi:probable HAF family extracellular repeat protein
VKKHLTMYITALTLLAALAKPAGLVAQDNPDHKHWHHHYKLIDMGTFGGSESYISPYFYSGPFQALNNAGTFASWGDTSELDPFGLSGNSGDQNFCFNYDGTPCYTSRAFQWQAGVKSEFPELHKGLSSAAAWISANDLIVGTSQNGETDPLCLGSPENFPENRAVLWRDGNIIDLGTLPEGGYESEAESVNSRGQVVGVATNTVPDAYSLFQWSSLLNHFDPYPYPYQERAFLWQDGVMTDLGTLGTGTDAWGMAINERGQVTGISYTSSTPNQVATPCAFEGAPIPTQDPFLWENGKMTDLGGLGGTCGFPYWLDNHGRVVGVSDLAGDQVQHPFLWTKAKGMRDLGTLGGSGSASMINNFGQVVGGSELENSDLHAFLWDGTMHDLGAINGCSYAFAINNSGQIVGNWGNNGCGQGAFLWENGGPMVDLGTLLSSKTDLSELGAVSINDRGEIAGHGEAPTGHGRAILFIPCDDNHPGVEGCDYSLVDATVATQYPVPRYVPSETQGLPQSRRSNRYHISGMTRATIGTASEGTDPLLSASTNDNGVTEDFLAADNPMVSLSGKGVHKCTPRGHPCESVPCCPGLVCKFSGGSTRAGYACEP